MVSLRSITHKSPSEVCARRRLFLLASPPLNGRRASSSCLAVAGRLGARSPLTVPAPAALPWLRGVALELPPYQLVGPESPHLRARCSGGADLERARGGRRGGACAAARVRPVHARPHVRGPVREVAWLPGRLGRLNSSRTRRLPSGSKCRLARRSWPERVATEAQLATGASSATQAFALG